MNTTERLLRLALAICTALVSIYNLEVSFGNFQDDLDQNMQFSSVTTGMTEPQRPAENEQRQNPLQEDILNQDNQGTSSWENDHNLVHIILTRFMQHQPDLLHLGRARLELFKSFCLPTMLQQTNKQFLWIIRVDPMLHPHLKEEFLQTLVSNTNQINVVVVGSNARVDDGHFRHPNATADINSSTVWLGNLDLVYSYHQAAQHHTVLETGLDADDGLALSFVQDLQTQTALLAQRQDNLMMAQQNQSNTATGASSSSWWKLWCVTGSAEWHFYSHYMNSSYGHMSESGSTSATVKATEQDQEEEKLCITPGLTRVSTSDYQIWKESNGTKQKGGEFPDLREWGHRFFIDHFYIQLHAREVKVNQVGGWSYLPGSDSVPAIRARTPTSAGMKGVIPRRVTSRPWTVKEHGTWLKIVNWFGLSMDQIQQSRSAIHDNLKLVLDDALQGQCSQGHSCRKRAAVMLEFLKNKAGVA